MHGGCATSRGSASEGESRQLLAYQLLSLTLIPRLIRTLLRDSLAVDSRIAALASA